MNNAATSQDTASALNETDAKRFLYPFIFLFLWSTGFSVAKIGLEYADPLTFLTLRYACVVALLIPVQIFFKTPLPSTAKAWWNLCVIGFLIQFMYFSCMYLSLKTGLSAGAMALIASMQPILVGIISPLFVGEKILLKQWVGLLLGFFGAAIVIASKSHVEAPSSVGILFAIIALLGMTMGVLYEKRTNSSKHPVIANLAQCAVGLVLSLPLALLLEKHHLTWAPAMLGSLAYLVICNSLIAISLLLAMVRHQQAARVAALFFLVPPLSAIAASLIVKEPMPFATWIGMIISAAGVWIANRSKATP